MVTSEGSVMTDTQQPAGSATSASAVQHGHGHGNSVAAWTAVGTIIVGSIVMAVGVVAASWPVSIVGGVICVVGGISGKVLSAMGFGVAGRSGQH
jgi:hypothetical protein